MTQTKTVPAARLSLPGAPEEWHTVDGLPGHFHPSIPVPLDHGLASKELLEAFLSAHTDRVTAAAAAWDAFRGEQIAKDVGDIGEFQAPACPLEIVQLEATKADHHALMAREQRTMSAREAAKARREGRAGEPNVKAELGAAGASTGE